MVSICELTRSILHPFAFPPLLKFSFSPQKIRGNMKQKVCKKRIASIYPDKRKCPFPMWFLEVSIWDVVTQSVMKIRREDSKC